MRLPIFFIIPVVLYSSVVVCQSAGDPQRQLAEERRRLVRTSDTVTPVQRVQPAVQQYSTAQRERARSQLQRNADRSSLTQVGTTPLQVVSIDRLQAQSDTTVEYQFESLQTLNIQDGDTSQADEEVKAESADVVEVDLQEETPAEDVAAAAEEISPEEPDEEFIPVVEKVVQSGAGQTLFRIIEDENRIVVLQVESSIASMKQAHQIFLP